MIAALLVVAVATFAWVTPCYYYDDSILDCRGKGLVEPPAGLWHHITALHLNENPITTFAKNAFNGFPNVVYFSTTHATLVEIDLGDFLSMAKLEALILHNNYIKTVIPAPAGTVFEELLAVDLNNNAITMLDPNFLFNAPKMNVLSIENNPIRVKHGQPIFIHNSVQILNIGSGCNFADFDIAALLAGVPNIVSIVLTDARVNNITGAFVKHKRLKTVVLSFNDITRVTSGTFAPETLLERLSLVGNPLKRLDRAALNKQIEENGSIFISNTPLACGCGYEDLLRWADELEITLWTECGGKDLCGFTRRRAPHHWLEEEDD